MTFSAAACCSGVTPSTPLEVDRLGRVVGDGGRRGVRDVVRGPVGVVVGGGRPVRAVVVPGGVGVRAGGHHAEHGEGGDADGHEGQRRPQLEAGAVTRPQCGAEGQHRREGEGGGEAVRRLDGLGDVEAVDEGDAGGLGEGPAGERARPDHQAEDGDEAVAADEREDAPRQLQGGEGGEREDGRPVLAVDPDGGGVDRPGAERRESGEPDEAGGRRGRGAGAGMVHGDGQGVLQVAGGRRGRRGRWSAPSRAVDPPVNDHRPDGDPDMAKALVSELTRASPRGVSDGARTRDTQDHNLVLYRLSYTHHVSRPARAPEGNRRNDTGAAQPPDAAGGRRAVTRPAAGSRRPPARSAAKRADDLLGRLLAPASLLGPGRRHEQRCGGSRPARAPTR